MWLQSTTCILEHMIPLKVPTFRGIPPFLLHNLFIQRREIPVILPMVEHEDSLGRRRNNRIANTQSMQNKSVRIFEVPLRKTTHHTLVITAMEFHSSVLVVGRRLLSAQTI